MSSIANHDVRGYWQMVYSEPHSYLVKLGLFHWNSWRQKHPDVTPMLEGANLNLLDLSGFNLRGANIQGANLFGTDLLDADLTDANLTKADFTGADLRNAFLCGADLSEARLIRTQALGTNFERAIFTGVCLEDWNIDSKTNLIGVICDYVYLKSRYSPKNKRYVLQERRPHSGRFEPGEFAKLFQTTLETVELIFRNGIDWQAFLVAFQKLEKEQGDFPVSIQSIETKHRGTVVIHLNVLPEQDKAKIEQSFKQCYKQELQCIEADYQEKFGTRVQSEELITKYRQRNSDFKAMIQVMAKAQSDFVLNMLLQLE
ncbi:MAG: pentapeptide repeat-containing protein [Coleofasciculus sp. G1-WW12-02]|uniref:pentapeptide repeat-containing protein n=1 Tax=unclassified Coleofasciculus TaxID=2692782 RepID=UPI0032FA07BD